MSWQAGGMGMRVQGEIGIGCPVDEVFAFVADQRNEPQFNPAMAAVEMVSEPPIGVGTTFRAQVRQGRRLLPMTIEYTVFDRPHRLASSTSMAGMDVDGALTFTPEPGGTRMAWSWTLHPHGVLRLASPVMVAIGRRREEAIWAGLKQLLESAEVGPS